MRWGILATGGIARAFCRDLALLDGARWPRSARGDRSRPTRSPRGTAAPRRTASTRALVEDPGVDVVYVATPHPLHREHVGLAFEAGKAVLCEKPVTLGAAEAERPRRAAREKGLFLMEAMWMRCNPLIRRLQQLVASGALGEVRKVQADLGFVVDKPPTDRMLDLALGAGALLDMGIYPLTFAQLSSGSRAPSRRSRASRRAGVDLDVAISLGYPSGATASVTTTMTAWSPRTRLDRDRPAAGSRWPRRSTAPTTATGRRTARCDRGGRPRRRRSASERLGVGLTHEALEVQRCLRDGETESPLVPLDDSVALMRLMDGIREQIGVKYAVDHASPPTG